jgi:hypothetical protein
MERDMMGHASKRMVLVSMVALFASVAASADEDDVGESIKQGAKAAARAVTQAGEKVSSEIQGKPDADGELVEGMRTNTGRGYGPAGCGLGSILFDPGSGFTQVLAATTNTSFGTQTFGITSGTSNCSASGRGASAARAFVEANRPVLARDIARGRGETISSLAQLAECADAARVGEQLQRRFSDIFPAAGRSDREVSRAVVDALRAEAALGCRALM